MLKVRFGEQAVTPQDFDMYQILFDRFQKSSIDIARRVLVDGDMPRAVAREEGITPQAVYALIKRIVAVINEIEGVDDNTPLVKRAVMIPDGREHDAHELMLLIGGRMLEEGD